MGRPALNFRRCAIYMDAALHPGSRILDGSPMRHRSCGHRRLTAASAVINSGPNHAVINPGRNHQDRCGEGHPLSRRAGHLDAALTDATGQRSTRSPAAHRHDLEQLAPRVRTRASLRSQEVTLISTSKLSRLENAEGKPRLRDVRDLIRFYGKEGTPQAGQLERWVKAAEVPGWWTDFGDEVLQDRIRLDTHLAYEADAAVERVYTLPFVPVLAADGRLRGGRVPGDGTPTRGPDRSADGHPAKRKEALKQREGLDPLKLVAVTHECTLRQIVGSPQDPARSARRTFGPIARRKCQLVRFPVLG